MTTKSVSRNDSCPCGSGQKYKKCCLDKAGVVAARPSKPDLPQYIAHILACRSSGNLIEAMRTCKTLLDHYPDNSSVLYHTADIMQISGLPDSSVMLLRKAIQIDPKKAIYHELLARVWLDLRKWDDACYAISCAIDLAPDNPTMLELKAHLLQFSADPAQKEEALQILKRIISLYPKYFSAYERLFYAYYERRLFAEADMLYQEMLTHNPPLEVLISFLTVSPTMNFLPEEITHQRERLEQNIETIASYNKTLENPHLVIQRSTMFWLAYHGLSNRPILEKLSALYRRIFPSLSYVAPHIGHIAPAKVIKIGFVSNSFQDGHVVMICFEHFIASFVGDARFEVVIFDIAGKGSTVSFIKSGLVTHVVLPQDVGPTMYQLIAEHACDVLVYTDIGLTANTYLLAFARLAPIQCCLTGVPITTGISTIDYFISSKLWEAPNAQDYFSETLIALDHPLIHIAKPDLPTISYTKEEISLPGEGTLYVCPVTIFKLHPDFYPIVIAILKQDPKGRAVFFKFPALDCSVVIDHFNRIAPEESARIHFIDWIPKEKFMQALALCDVIIDPFHYGLATTLYQVYAVGAPLVTWSGQFIHGRTAAGIYEQMGITELTAKDWDDYVQIAVRLGNDKAFNAAMRKKILANNHAIYGDKGAEEEFKQFLEEKAGYRPSPV